MVTTAVYVISGVLAAVGGVLLTSRLGAGVPTAGTGFELQAIAACVIGGASLSGARGSAIGAACGALIIGVLNNGGNLLAINAFYLQIAIGALILVAVGFDQMNTRNAARGADVRRLVRRSAFGSLRQYRNRRTAAAAAGRIGPHRNCQNCAAQPTGQVTTDHATNPSRRKHNAERHRPRTLCRTAYGAHVHGPRRRPAHLRRQPSGRHHRQGHHLRPARQHGRVRPAPSRRGHPVADAARHLRAGARSCA